MPRSLLLFSLLLAPVLAQSDPGFTLVSDDVLLPFADLDDGFGFEDKFLACNGDMIFVDLDEQFLQQQCDDGTSSSCACSDAACPVLKTTADDTLEGCQAACAATDGCTELDYNDDPDTPDKVCTLRACTDYPPQTYPIDNTVVYSYTRGLAVKLEPSSNSWSFMPINASACPDPNQPPAPLTPRDSGYTMGVVSVEGRDRLIILGGDKAENNVRANTSGGGGGRTFQIGRAHV